MEIKSVAIVNGASQGIGQATALRLARDFAAVVLVARSKDKLEKTACELKSVGAEVTVCALDLREPQAAETVVTATLERFGRIDASLNIAGAVPRIDLFEMADAQWDDGMALKFHGRGGCDNAGLEHVEGLAGLRCVHLRKRHSRSETWICRRRGD
jgi:3-oxoacyl-[acyl-carrier protein] reductase